MLTYPQLPLPFRVLNRAGAALRSLGIELLPFRPDAVMEAASKHARLHDFAPDPSFHEALAVFCRSAEEDARLHFAGRIGIRRLLLRSLETRLRCVHAQKTQPHIAQTKLEPPLIVVGLPRSGTTFLHHLLTLDADTRPLLFWELMEPIPGPGPDRRRETLRKTLADMKKGASNLDAKHHFDADNPEECMLLLDSTLISLSFWTFAPVYGYAAWFRAQDQLAPYRTYRWLLQYFQHQSPGRRFTLKAPAHTGALTALREHIPNARIIQTHRDPAEVVPSLNSLFFSLHALVSERLDIPRMTTENMAQVERLLAGSEALRAVSPHSILDVHYGEIFRDPVACVKRIYQHFGMEFSDALAQRIREHAANRPKEKFGQHSYSAEDFNLSPGAIRERFADYCERYLPNDLKKSSAGS